MKKEERVKSNLLFNNIINDGIKVSNDLYSIFYINSDNEKPLFGVGTSKKNGNAVTRNKLKRQTRAIINETKLLFKNNRNYIIIIKKKSLNESYENRLNSFKSLIGEINEK